MKLSPKSFQKIEPKLKVYYKADDGKIIKHKNKDITFSSDSIKVTTHTRPHPEDEKSCILSFTVKALKEIELNRFEVYIPIDLQDQCMLANGFQSWSQARELTKNDRIPAIHSSIAWYTQLNLQGDYDIFQHSGERGIIHSSSYTHFRDIHKVITFFGSISENYGYTYFIGDFNKNKLGIYKDVLGMNMTAGQEIDLVSVYISQGTDAEATIWDNYAKFYPDTRAVRDDDERRHVNGWTSWYNYYSDVSEKIIDENLNVLTRCQYPINIFQIDDGFQTAIGDWLSINQKFPSGMKIVADKIKKAGFKAGLWLAPYAAAFNSNLAKNHPDWLIIDPATKKPVVAGPNWGGFYAINIYHPDVREYLKKVFNTVLIDWGFDMLKLDFCFAAAMIPLDGKSRGQVMWEAMDLIRELVGPEKLILGCGVPLACAFRKVDYCRIGSDVAPWWEDGKLKRLHVRERVSTANSLVSTLNRWSMSNRMFGNDPDVMIIRNLKNKLTFDERYTLCVLNNILGALVFSSDNVEKYGQEECLLYRATFPKVVPHTKSVLEFRKNWFMVNFTVKHKWGEYKYTTYTNLSSEERAIYLPEGTDETAMFFATDNDMHIKTPDKSEVLFYLPSSEVKLKIHETKTFMHIPKATENSLIFLGGTGHIVPGVDLNDFEKKEEGDVKMNFKHENSRSRKTYFGIGNFLYTNELATTPSFKVNNETAKYEWIPVNGIRGEKVKVLAFYIAQF